MKGYSTINGELIYDLIRNYDNCLKATEDACKDHAHNSKVQYIKENKE